MKDLVIEEIKSLGIDAFIHNRKHPKRDVKKLMKTYANAYYNGNALIKDEDFEYLIDVLRAISPKDRYLIKPGWGYNVKRGKKHLYEVVGTLDYTFDYKVLIDKFKNQQNILILPKFDGINFAVYYKKGKLKYTLTRGNGSKGRDITQYFKNIEFELPERYKNLNFGINGEIILEKTNLERPARDFIASYLNGKENFIKEINFMPFGLLGWKDNIDYQTQLEILEDMTKIKLIRYNFHSVPTLEELTELFKYYKEKFYIDGLVISNLDKSRQIAFKFNEN